MTVKDKVLASATKIFSKHGYRDAKVADIVLGAKANIAAVNYYFGSKEKLFVQVLRHTFAVAETTHPISGGLDATAPAEERLAAFARAILLRSFDKGAAGNFNRIMSKTVHSPGSPINTICDEVTHLEVVPLQLIFQDFLDEDIDDCTRGVATLNFLSLASIISKYPFVVEKIFGPDTSDETIANFIEQQISSIIAATRALNVTPSAILSHAPSL